MTREEWAKRPMEERRIAAEEWCHGWNDARGTDANGMSMLSGNVRDHYALDLLDPPGDDRVEPMPWRLQIAAMLGIGGCKFAEYASNADWASDRLADADALLAAAQATKVAK